MRRTYSKYAQQAAKLMGQQIKLARKKRKMSESLLAERAGISRTTLQKIEAGEMTSAIGIVFELATIVGVCLFESSDREMALQMELTQCKICLLPQRIRNNKILDDNF